MNKRLYFSICIGTLCAFFAVWSVILALTLYNITNENKEEREIGTAIAEKTVSKKLSHYLVISESDGVVLYKVYENGDKEQESILDISTLTMRETDKRNFAAGIVLKTKEDVIHLIEDYTS